VFLNLVWFRVYDFVFLPLGVAYTFELIRNYNNMYNRMETLVEERTKELSAANKKLQEEIVVRSKAEKKASINEEKFYGIYNAVNEVIFIHDAETGAIVDVR
jgi:C4-dicarboxylate-specific signal transduction histidine kinase